MTTNFCPNCGSQLKAGAKFCGGCGQGIGLPTDSSMEALYQEAVTAFDLAKKAKDWTLRANMIPWALELRKLEKQFASFQNYKNASVLANVCKMEIDKIFKKNDIIAVFVGIFFFPLFFFPLTLFLSLAFSISPLEVFKAIGFPSNPFEIFLAIFMSLLFIIFVRYTARKKLQKELNKLDKDGAYCWKPPWKPRRAVFGIWGVVLVLLISIVRACGPDLATGKVEQMRRRRIDDEISAVARKFPELAHDASVRRLAEGIAEDEYKEAIKSARRNDDIRRAAAIKFAVFAFIIGIPTIIFLATRKRTTVGNVVGQYSPSMSPAYPYGQPLVATSPETDAFLRRAFMALEDGDWQEAYELLEHALNRESENAKAYFGKALMRLKIPTEAALRNTLAAQGPKLLWDDSYYQKALRLADSAYRTALLDFHPQLQRVGIYLEATDVMNSATTADQFKYAADKFSSISGYKDADALAEQCKESIYQDAVGRMKAAHASTDFLNAANAFDLIRGYKDADALFAECKYQQALAEIKMAKTARQFEILANAFSKAKDLRDSAALAKQCRDEGTYITAYGHMKQANYEFAIELFNSISGYKDADALAEECRRLLLVKKKQTRMMWATFLVIFLAIVGAIIGLSVREARIAAENARIAEEIAAENARIAARNKVTIYISGYEKGPDDTRIATLWTDRKATRLGTGESSAEAVFVVGKDVFVVGGEKNSAGINVAKVWKNGTAQNLTNGRNDAFANTIYVGDGNVYAAGHEKNAENKQHAALWKNGIVQHLSGSHRDAVALSVFASGNNVYVAGYETDDRNRHIATLWKNGTPQRLNESGNASAEARSVFVHGDDVYVAGHETNWLGKSVATLWINGIVYDLSDGRHDAVAQSVTVSNGNVYVVGQEEDSKGLPTMAKLWINGESRRIKLSSDRQIAHAHSVFVHLEHVYVAGWGTGAISKKPTEARAIFWQNSAWDRLGSGAHDAKALSIFVAREADADNPPTTENQPSMLIAPRRNRNIP